MGVTVAFDYPTWIEQYPEFQASSAVNYAGVTPAQALAYFSIAVQLHDNTGSGPVNDPVQQLTLLNMIVSHIAQLVFGSQIAPARGIPGRISSASEGSVSASFELPNMEERAAYWSQTTYGLLYWQATRQFRLGRYHVPLRRTLPRPF